MRVFAPVGHCALHAVAMFLGYWGRQCVEGSDAASGEVLSTLRSVPSCELEALLLRP